MYQTLLHACFDTEGLLHPIALIIEASTALPTYLDILDFFKYFRTCFQISNSLHLICLACCWLHNFEQNLEDESLFKGLTYHVEKMELLQCQSDGDLFLAWS